MTNDNGLPTRAEVLEHGPALLPDWLEMHVPITAQDTDRADHVRLVCDDRSGGELNIKYRVLRTLRGHRRYLLTATDWRGMVREAITILEGER